MYKTLTVLSVNVLDTDGTDSVNVLDTDCTDSVNVQDADSTECKCT